MTLSIIAASGSLRQQSTNTRLLQTIQHNLIQNVSFTLYKDIEQLEAFNPDKEDKPSAHVQNWIQQVRDADVFIAASPEYAHGIPGAFKNALDWLVGTDAFIDKPFCLYHACPRSTVAPAALLEVLKTMSGLHLAAADVTINLHRNYETCAEELTKEESKQTIMESITHLYKVVNNRP